MDENKIRLTLASAAQYYELLLIALDANNHRAVGSAMHNLGRELKLLERLVHDDSDSPPPPERVQA